MMTFFNPKASFLKWLARHAAGRMVFDVGCGNGTFLRRMQHFGIRALGVEPFPEFTGLDRQTDLLSSFFAQQAQECPTLHNTPNLLVLFCRPCHNLFVQETLPLLHETSEALYISLPGNLTLDLPSAEATEVEAPGLRGEKVYRVRAYKGVASERVHRLLCHQG